MAALDRRVCVLDECAGQSWSCWLDKADASTAEGTSGEECSKNVKKRMETMTLRKEDMCIYGHCPSQDEFYLVVCSHCGQVVKPQAFEKHCERRHGPLSKLCSPHSSLSSPSSLWPQQGRPPSQHSALREGREGKQQGAGPPRVPPLHSPIHKPPKAQKEGISILQLDKFPHGSPPSPPYSSTPTPRDPPWHSGSTPPKTPSKTPPKMPPPTEKPLQKGTDVQKPLPGPRTYSRTYKKVPKKECDLDKHCGVLDPERKKVCTRLLTCNIHSIHQRRQVVGRSKNFDQLVFELKMSSKSRERAPPVIKDVPEDSSPCPQTPAADPLPQPSRRQAASYVSLRSRTSSESGVEVEEPPQCPPAHSASLSSEESDGENQEEATDLPTSTCHPKPLGLCTFGARVLGCSVLAFDRRLFHLRSAFSAMVEQHLSAHLWKKIPQVSDLRSHHSPSAFTPASQSHSAVHSPPSRVPALSASSLRTCAPSVPRRPPGDTSTSGQSEPRTSDPPPPSKPPTKAPEASGPGRPRNPVGRSGKQLQQAKAGQLQDSPAARKRRKSPPRDEDLPGQNRSFSTPKDRQPPSVRPSLSPSHGPVNGILSPSSKARPLLHVSEMQGLAKRSPAPITSHMSPQSPPESSSNDGGGASGLHRKALGHEHKGPSRKRKTSGACSPEPPSRHPKPNSLPFTHAPSSLFSWKRDSKARPVSISLEKKLDAQKPKLHH